MLTLLEYSRLVDEPLQKGIIDVFPRTSPVLELLPFKNITGTTYRYTREKILPTTAFRNINKEYVEDTGENETVIAQCAVLGGESRVDHALAKAEGSVNDVRALADGQKAKSASLFFTKAFFKGDCTTDPSSFDGLQSTVTGDQKISMTGGTLTLPFLDTLIDQVEGGPDVLFCNKTLRRKISALVRAAGGAMESVTDNYGRILTGYAGIPIRPITIDETGAEILGFIETSSTSSIYAVKFGIGTDVCGLQVGPMEILDLGLVGVWYSTLIEWITSIAIFSEKSVARLSSITNT